MGKGQVRAEDLHRVLDAEISKSRAGADWSKFLDVAAVIPTFGFGRTVLADLQMPYASWVVCAAMWDELGRQVRTGQASGILKSSRSRTVMAAALEEVGGKYGSEGVVERQVIRSHVAALHDVTATIGPTIDLPGPPSCANARTVRVVDPRDPGTGTKAAGARVVNTNCQLIEATDEHLKAHRAPLAWVAARPPDSALLAADVDRTAG